MQFFPVSTSLVVAILALPSLITASPTPLPGESITFVDLSSFNSSESTLVPRSGTHYAHLCENNNCGDAYKYVPDFGCGGVCYNGFHAQSVLLGQQGTGNPKPTGSMYSSTDCSGSQQSVGIESGQLTGCTAKQGGGTWQSAYLYFNC